MVMPLNSRGADQGHKKQFKLRITRKRGKVNGNNKTGNT